MKQVQSVLVIGAGIGGLAAATGFARRGASVTVVERRHANQVLGAGINQPANSLRVLRDLGVLLPIIDQGFPYDRLEFHDRDGNHVVDAPSSLGGDVPSNCAVSRAVLADALYHAAVAAGARIIHDFEVRELLDDGRKVTVAGAESRFGGFDLAVAFDGMNSPVRRQLFGDAVRPVFTGHAVWRVTVPRDPSVDCCQLFHGAATKAGLIPISRDEMYLFLVTQEPGNPRHDPAAFHALLMERLAEYGGLVGRLRDGLHADAAIIYSPLSETLLDGDWHKGRIVVAGDAAHLSAPHLTQGAAMALEDAALLVETIDRDVPLDASLSEFARRRVPRVALVQKVSGGILRAEMSVTEESYAASVDALREIPVRLAAVEAVLNQPY